MMMTKPIQPQFIPEDIETLDVELKVGILGTVNDAGLPHLTMISSLRPYSETGMVWGQFTEGLSKQYIRQNPKIGFLIMSLDKQMWRGKADFTHTAKNGPEYDNFNDLPMFRYNAYFGVHTVYYMDLVGHYGMEPLPMGKVIYAAVNTMLARIIGRKQRNQRIINPWVKGLFNKVDNLKFIGYVGEDGYPVVIPVIQAQVIDSQRVVFSRAAYGADLEAIPAGVSMAVFGMSFSMEDVLLRGTFQGIRRVGGVRCGVVDIDWVYNSMPPVPQQIFPPVQVNAVTEF